MFLSFSFNVIPQGAKMGTSILTDDLQNGEFNHEMATFCCIFGPSTKEGIGPSNSPSFMCPFVRSSALFAKNAP